MKLSLIVPIYNAEYDLPDLFASIEYQIRPFDEVILVDNNSSDRSLELCNSFKKNSPLKNITIEQEKTPGPGPARNRGIDRSSGDIICFTDSDCILCDSFAKNTESFFIENNSISIIGGIASSKNMLNPDTVTKKSLCEEFSIIFWSHERSYHESFPLNNKDDIFKSKPFYITTYNMACRKTVFGVLKGFKEIRTMEDIDFWLRACENKFNCEAGIPEIKVYHKNRKNLISLMKQYYYYIHSLPWILKTHFKGKFFVTYQTNRIFSASFLTGLIEINPHTLLILIICINISLTPYILILIIFHKYISMYRQLSKLKKPFLIKAFVFAIIMEIRRLAMSAGAVMGSIKHKILCIL
ncbi:MAG: glycosyltransferase family 2 protein [Candidatus Aureabacteria bacterium]|nr:glycosyltransferase family 2 protein [Candidatus Auribacterota bacterium]